ncbi:MAG TPA: glycosyltransferase family 2 protein [Gaiellaceae bacterium]|nr:glycosyltransferase family 2 protein [Gaiellaceae bacterium]
MPSGVAVVLRTKDRPLFLERAVASVLGQTHDDLELVVVNDGGDPAAVDEVVARAADARIQVLHNPASEGMVAATNRALAASASTFVAVHDDDDTWAPGFLARTVAHLETSGAMGVVATADRVVERVVDGRIELLSSERLFPELRFVSLYRLCFENLATPIAFLYRREALATVGGYEERFGGAADWEFALRFVGAFEVDYLRSEQALAFYHHRPDATGIETNSVYTDEHRRLESRIANELLRADLAAGRLGLGLIVNAVRFGYEADERMFAREKEAMDERVEYLASCVAKVDRRVEALQEAVTPSARLKADLAFVRQLPRAVARRLGRG